ncbi:MAG: transcription antitermination factor NusB [Mogibacterium sp.]|nr:transcription antitermination factor NusB [Mogibacterium sp.]
MDRQIIREQTMQLVYQMDITGNFDYEQLSVVEENEAVLRKNKAISVLTAIRDHIDEIDQCIRENVDHWRPERIAKTDLAILRTAVAEILYVDSIPAQVSVNEAVLMAKKYGEARSYAFVNSVLGRIVRSRGSESDE